MCGIIGVVGSNENVVSHLMEGLRRLEYRGYDSAGIAVLNGGKVIRRRAQGNVHNLELLLNTSPLKGSVGIGHTRWASHGSASEHNAHPHMTDQVAVVHNGIIENFEGIKKHLISLGHVFESDTDTEVVVHFLTQCIREGMSRREAVLKCIKTMKGAFALAILFAGNEKVLYGVRIGSPLAIGWGDGEMYLGSDALTLSHLTRRISYLETGDWVEITGEGAEVFDSLGQSIERPITSSVISGALIGKGNYQHFMLKEIFEQPTAIADTLGSFMNLSKKEINLDTFPFPLSEMNYLSIIACGSSYYSGLVGRCWLERLARVRVNVAIASEFRYSEAVLLGGETALFISQSGETSDTLAAMQYCASKNQHLIGLVNVMDSSIDRACDTTLLTKAGPEIGVASTKAFTTQMVVLACLTIAAARARGHMTKDREHALCSALLEVPVLANEVLNQEHAIKEIARSLVNARNVLYLGRDLCYPIAMEGALKLKELSYIHAEGYPAGEMKHGPIALIDEDMPVIFCAPSDDLFQKTASSMREVAARGGRVILLSDEAGVKALGEYAHASVVLPTVDPFITPILYTLPVQLLSYYVALFKGTDVDQPRNLAKSVTVE